MARVNADARRKASPAGPDDPTPAALGRIQVAVRKAEEAREAVDRAVLKARDAGYVFSEIADAAGRSVSWVQSVVYRSDAESISFQERMPCPVCGKELAKSWYDRHIRTEHPDVEVIMVPEVIQKSATGG